MADASTLANVNGSPAVVLNIRRQSGTNTVQVIQAVKDRIEELRATLPPGYAITIVRDQGDFIKASIRAVQEHLVLGALLAALVVLLFLGNWRSTVIAAIAIPTSIIATFGLIWYQGFTLNSMTMLALTLSVGIVIDDAIVVLENIYRFIEEKGRDPFEAAVEATKEIGLAVLATTLSLVAIFLPIGFMSGIVGRFMKSFGLTMAFAVMVSLLVSFTLTPMLAARWLKVRRQEGDAAHPAHTSRESGWFGPHRSRLHEAARVGAVAPARGRPRRVPGAAVERPALHDRQQELPAGRRPVGVRDRTARARRHEPAVDRDHREPDRHRACGPAIRKSPSRW